MDADFVHGGLDLNFPPEGEFSGWQYDEDLGNKSAETAGRNADGAMDEPDATAAGPSGVGVGNASDTMNTAGSGVPTGDTVPTEDSGSDGEVQSTPEGYTPRTPFVGMKFDSVEAAKIHYNKYSKHVGFSIKSSTSRRSVMDNELDKALFVCNKSGKEKEGEPEPVKLRLKTYTKLTDCKARMRVKRKGVNWEVTQFVEEHTHELIQKFALKKYLRSHKRIPKEERKFVELLHEVNLTPGRILQIMGEIYGSIKNVPYDSKAISNYTATLSDEHRFKDAHDLILHFKELQKEDPRFFYKYTVDSMSRVENLFWVDGAARDVYKLYHDCISFDTTYMVNMYNMPCAPFIGINRYGQSIQLGCGFMRNERIANFVWLFQTFLEAMDGLHPLNIITDQDQGMRTAILLVFLEITHRNCRWHIMQKVQEKLGPLASKFEALRRNFNEIIDYSLTVEEFETKWAEMLVNHGVADNQHLSDLYDLRTFFVPAYFMDRFFPFLQTTARSEGFNAVLKLYANPHDSLLRFFKQYMKLQEKIEVAEDSNEFEGEDKKVRVWSDYPMEKQMLSTYTLPIYRRFYRELRKITSYNITDFGAGLYEIKPIYGSVFGYGSRSYMVQADVQSETYNCQCCKFKRDGILCCHALKVMSHLGAVHYMPQHYILPRWCIPPPDIVVPDAQPQVVPTGKLSRKDMRLLRFGNLCTEFKRIAIGAAASEKTNEVAEKYMKALEKELADIKKAASDATKRKKNKSVAHPQKQQQPETAGSAPMTQPNGPRTSGPAPPMTQQQYDPWASGSIPMQTEPHDPWASGSAPIPPEQQAYMDSIVQDPPTTTRRGRPEQKRKKGALHLQPARKSDCKICKVSDHDLKSCPVRLANPERYSMFGLFN